MSLNIYLTVVQKFGSGWFQICLEIYIPLPIKYANHDCGAFGDNPNWNFSFADLDSLEPDGGLIIILDKNRAVGERKPLDNFSN